MTLAKGARQLVVQDALEIWNKIKSCMMSHSHGNTYDGVFGIIRVEVNTAYEHGCISRGCGDNDLLGAALQVSRSPINNR